MPRYSDERKQELVAQVEKLMDEGKALYTACREVGCTPTAYLVWSGKKAGFHGTPAKNKGKLALADTAPPRPRSIDLHAETLTLEGADGEDEEITVVLLRGKPGSLGKTISRIWGGSYAG